MRAVFGLGGILVVLAVIVYIMGGKGGELDHDKAAIDAGKQATAEVSQVAGRDENGDPVKLSATLEPQSTNGNTTGLLVTSVKADGPYAKFWKLQRNDLITEIGPLPVKQVVTDASAGDDYVMTAYQQHQPLTIMRDGTKMTLDGSDSNAPATPTNSAAPAKPKGDPLQDQLNAIQSQAVPTH